MLTAASSAAATASRTGPRPPSAVSTAGRLRARGDHGRNLLYLHVEDDSFYDDEPTPAAAAVKA